MLCNDREVLGPWVNPSWLNALAALASVCILVVLSTLLSITTIFPGVDITTVGLGMFAALPIALIAAAAMSPGRRPVATASRQHWTMPQLEKLGRRPRRVSAG